MNLDLNQLPNFSPADIGAVLATVDDCLGDGAGSGIAAAALTDSTRLATLRGLVAGSGAGSGGVLIAPPKATYKTRALFGAAFAEAASADDEASRAAFFSESDGRSAATAFGAANKDTQAIKSAAINDRALERRISLNILHLCKIGFANRGADSSTTPLLESRGKLIRFTRRSRALWRQNTGVISRGLEGRREYSSGAPLVSP